MPPDEADLLRRTADQLDEHARAARRAVDGLGERAGPHVWRGASPRKLAEQVATAEVEGRRASDAVTAAAAELRSRAAALELGATTGSP